MTAEQSASGWATLERARAAALTIAEQRQLSDADPAAYERYLVRRAVEFDAMDKDTLKNMPFKERSDLQTEVMALGLRMSTGDPEQLARLEQLFAEERDMTNHRASDDDAEEPVPRAPFRVDWMAADFAGEQRNLEWYLARAEKGDQQAARRAVRWMVDSLTPDALAQNGGAVDPQLAAALHALLAPVAIDGDSDVLWIARQGPSRRPTDTDKRARMWWACVDMRRRLVDAGDSMTQEAAAAAAATLSGEQWLEPSSLAKEYRRLLSAVAAFVECTTADDSDESPPAFLP
jgi:hypothetical protein